MWKNNLTSRSREHELQNLVRLPTLRLSPPQPSTPLASKICIYSPPVSSLKITHQTRRKQTVCELKRVHSLVVKNDSQKDDIQIQRSSESGPRRFGPPEKGRASRLKLNAFRDVHIGNLDDFGCVDALAGQASGLRLSFTFLKVNSNHPEGGRERERHWIRRRLKPSPTDVKLALEFEILIYLPPSAVLAEQAYEFGKKASATASRSHFMDSRNEEAAKPPPETPPHFRTAALKNSAF
ncbi:hypothetical protein BDZ89DRAFT_1045586 [Hymenopellis radicata]|nr:hypothetical protein BDZ89DRAFT_1045586 [Hymenopellis radicata]